MSLFRVVPRLLALCALVLPPFLLAGALAARLPGALAGAVCGLLGVLVLSFLPERIIARSQGALSEIPAGLQKSFDFAIARTTFARPQLAILPLPYPNALICRSLGSPGLILLSQAMLAMLSEQELRAILRKAALELQEPATTVRSMAAALAHLTLKLMPQGWVDAALTGRRLPDRDVLPLAPWPLLRFLTLLPFAQGLLNLSRRSVVEPPLRAAPTAGTSGTSGGELILDPALWAEYSALQKMSRNAGLGASIDNPGTVHLFLADPRSSAALLSTSR